jgi:hypothetical protein
MRWRLRRRSLLLLVVFVLSRNVSMMYSKNDIKGSQFYANFLLTLPAFSSTITVHRNQIGGVQEGQATYLFRSPILGQRGWEIRLGRPRVLLAVMEVG